MSRSNWIGQTIGGRYEIQELLGQGGMSAVYKAYDPNLRRVVAAKIIHPHLSNDPQFVARFEEEAAAVAQLRHPNIIQVYDFNNDDDSYFIIFEFVPGETVQARLKRMKSANRTMDVGEAIKVTTQVANGLQNAHSKGLIHRDIKPANIILNVTGEPIIMDFGIAKIMGGTQHTATGAVLGTARYMSPEQIQGNTIDPRTDIYSLGVTFFEMLGGRPPFEANSAMSLMMMHMTDPVPDLNAIRSEVSPELVAVVNKSLAKDPNDRYQSASQMAAALRAAGSNVGKTVGATIVEPIKPSAEKTVIEPFTEPEKETKAAATAAAATVASTDSATSPVPTAAAKSAGQADAPVKSGGSRTFFYLAGAVVLLLLIAGGVWAAFFRDTGGEDAAEGGEEVPAIVVEPTDTPDSTATQEALDAGVNSAVETRLAAAAAQTAEAAAADVPLATDTAEPAEEPTAEPTEEPTPEPEDTEEPTDTPEPEVQSIGSVDTVEGDVLLVTADGEQLPLTENAPITVGSEFVTGADGQLELTLEDGSILQMIEDSRVRLDALGSDPANELAQTAYTQFGGDILLRVPPGGSEQAVYSEAGVLLATLFNPNAAADGGKKAALAKQAQQSSGEAAMALHMEENRVFVACFSGVCNTTNDLSLAEGWEKVITYDGAFLSSQFMTNETPSYGLWQTSCVGCLPELGAPIPTATPTPTAEPTAIPTVTIVPAGSATPTPVDVTGTPDAEATDEPTEEGTPTAEAPVALAARITGITLVDGRYYVDFQTIGYTAQVPGRHVHFYFDTVSEQAAGVPGAGPWKLYGGPSPFTEYAQSDHVFEPTAMCIRVANEDHSIIYGSGNCFPLPTE